MLLLLSPELPETVQIAQSWRTSNEIALAIAHTAWQGSWTFDGSSVIAAWTSEAFRQLVQMLDLVCSPHLLAGCR